MESAVSRKFTAWCLQTHLSEPRLFSAVGTQTQTFHWPINDDQTALMDTEMWQRMFRINIFFYGGQYLFCYTLSSFYDKPANINSSFYFIF